MTTIQSSAKPKSSKKSPTHKRSSGNQHDIEELDEKDQPLLHDGAMLGQLPSLAGSRQSPTKAFSAEVDAVMNNKVAMGITPSRKADEKKPKKKKSGKRSEVPPDMPSHYLCQLTQQPMSDPVKSSFGHVFERSAIINWFSQQGRICPLTGKPHLNYHYCTQPVIILANK